MNVYQRKSNFEDQIIATLLYLHLNGTIKITDKSIQIIKGYENLLEHEKLIIDYCTNNVDETDFSTKLDTAINKDTKKLGYVYTKYSSEASVKEFIGIIILFNMMYGLISMPAFAMMALKLFLLLVISYFLVLIGLFIYESLSKQIKLTIRTEKALVLCAKLNGLKIFIKDFSIINNRRLQEIELYEDYIIYGIVFNLKGKLNDDAKMMYERIQNKIFYKNN